MDYRAHFWLYGQEPTVVHNRQLLMTTSGKYTRLSSTIRLQIPQSQSQFDGSYRKRPELYCSIGGARLAYRKTCSTYLFIWCSVPRHLFSIFCKRMQKRRSNNICSGRAGRSYTWFSVDCSGPRPDGIQKLTRITNSWNCTPEIRICSWRVNQTANNVHAYSWWQPNETARL